MNIKFGYCKCIRICPIKKDQISEKNTSLAGARTQKSITLVHGKNSKCMSLIMNVFQWDVSWLTLGIFKISHDSHKTSHQWTNYFRTVKAFRQDCNQVINKGQNLAYVVCEYPLMTDDNGLRQHCLFMPQGQKAIWSSFFFSPCLVSLAFFFSLFSLISLCYTVYIQTVRL